MTNSIEVNGIKLYAYHGCLSEETKIGGNYIVDVHLITDFTEAAQTDNLDKTIDYVIINQIVTQEMAIPAKLIEHVGQRIFDKIKYTANNIKSLRVKITKLSPPINGNVDNVAIVISS